MGFTGLKTMDEVVKSEGRSRWAPQGGFDL